MSADLVELGNALAPFLGIALALVFLTAPSWSARSGRPQNDEDRQRRARYSHARSADRYPAEWERNE